MFMTLGMDSCTPPPPNMTSISFCHWINEQLHPNSILKPGFPRPMSTETGRNWLHELGFEVLDKTKEMANEMPLNTQRNFFIWWVPHER